MYKLRTIGKQSFIFVLFFVMLHVICFMSHANAQQVSLSISPPLLEIFTKPGKSFLFAYKITNYGDPVVLVPSVNNFAPRGIYGQVQILNSLEGPVSFNLDNANYQLNKPFFLKSNQSTQLLLRIKVNPGAPSGDYYYNVNVTTDNSGTISQNEASQVKTTIGANILITVSKQGEIDILPQIEDFSVYPTYSLKIGSRIYKFFESTDPVPIRLVVSNNGSTLMKPKGTINLKGNFGETASFGVMPDNVLAHSSRLLTASPSADIDCKNNPNLCKNNYSLILSGFFIGKYELKANVNFGENTLTTAKTIVFYGLPIKLIAATILCIFIIIILVKKIQKDS